MSRHLIPASSGSTCPFRAPLLRFSVTVLILWIAVSSQAVALQPGSQAPGFELPWLGMEGAATLNDLLATDHLTVLVTWSRKCPHCAEVALGIDRLAERAAPLGASVTGILFGPDDPVSLRLLLETEGVETLHLWDEHKRVGAAYGLGIQNLGVFVLDRTGRVRAVFDSSIDDLVASVAPALVEVRDDSSAPEAARDAAAGEALSRPPPLTGLPDLTVDGRLRLQSAENARLGDLGLYGEELGNGTLFLFRWDLIYRWRPVRGVEIVPWLRVSNEDDVILTEGPEQLSSVRGTVSLHARKGRFAGTLGAFPVAVSPLLLQRWDEEDAPPLGGVSGCSTCGAGASGINQYSLEILEPEYTFEGLAGSFTHRFVRLRGWLAVPRWEQRRDRFGTDGEPARFRRILHGSAVDLGRGGSEEPVFGLARPVGARVAYLNVGDDRRTVTPLHRRPVEEHDEEGLLVLVRVEPVDGFSAEAEHVWWNLDLIEGTGDWGEVREKRRFEERALRAGIRGRRAAGSLEVWGRAHFLRTEPGFDPLYAALTYEPNQVGWRAAGGVSLRDGGAERAALSLFYRGVRETEERLVPGRGKVEDRILSASLQIRPLPALLTGLHVVLTKTDYTKRMQEELNLRDLEGTGLSFDAAWEGWSNVDPMMRVDAIRRDDGIRDTRTIWQAYLSLRVIS